VVDCDPGIDDAIALAYLAGERAAGHLGDMEVVAVGGNVGVDWTARNATYMLDHLGLHSVAVHRGAGEPLTPLATALDATAFHGHDGLGGLHDPRHPDRSTNADPDRLSSLFSTAVAGSSALLAIGPLTNLARWLRGPSPAVPRRMVVMGGAFGHPGGNITPWAEYNFHLDGVAAQRVMASGLPLTVVPLDVSEQVLIRPGDLGALTSSPRGTLVRRLLEASIENHRREMGIDGCIMHDALAAAAVFDPSLLEYTRGHVDVVADGDLRGQCTLEPDPTGTIQVALGVEVERARSQILECLSRL
jgi:purine nucleosidase